MVLLYLNLKKEMRAIKLEEAQKDYYPKPSHMAVKYADAFTLMPDGEDEHTRHVHYWVKRERFEAQLSFNEGYIYVLENRSQPGILKIGYTDRSPQARLKEINGATGVIIPWNIANAFPCKAPSHIEAIVHKQLSKLHVSKEGYAVSLSMAEDTIKHIIEENQAGI